MAKETGRVTPIGRYLHFFVPFAFEGLIFTNRAGFGQPSCVGQDFFPLVRSLRSATTQFNCS
jgi:hypothetical protein